MKNSFLIPLKSYKELSLFCLSDTELLGVRSCKSYKGQNMKEKNAKYVLKMLNMQKIILN